MRAHSSCAIDLKPFKTSFLSFCPTGGAISRALSKPPHPYGYLPLGFVCKKYTYVCGCVCSSPSAVNARWMKGSFLVESVLIGRGCVRPVGSTASHSYQYVLEECFPPSCNAFSYCCVAATEPGILSPHAVYFLSGRTLRPRRPRAMSTTTTLADGGAAASLGEGYRGTLFVS